MFPMLGLTILSSWNTTWWIIVLFHPPECFQGVRRVGDSGTKPIHWNTYLSTGLTFFHYYLCFKRSICYMEREKMCGMLQFRTHIFLNAFHTTSHKSPALEIHFSDTNLLLQSHNTNYFSCNPLCIHRIIDLFFTVTLIPTNISEPHFANRMFSSRRIYHT